MAVKKWYVVIPENGLNLREAPSKDANILKVLNQNTRIEADNTANAPDGWIAIKGGGFVMKQFLK